MVEDNEKTIDHSSMSFEEAMEELEETVEKLETGDLSLEHSLQLFERGQQLAAYCNLQLESAVLKVEQLSSDGEIVEISKDG